MRFMRSAGRRGARGFSLVELVIVIVIIGIIAAIAIPRISRGSKGAVESALIADLAVLRNAVELYASEHDGDYPGLKADGGAGTAKSAEALISQLTKYSKQDGTVNDALDEANGFIYGPYLRKGIPPLPVGEEAVRGSRDVLIDDTNTPPSVVQTGGEGWAYNPITGDIVANSEGDNEAGDMQYNEY